MPMRVMDGEEVSLSCVVTGKPTPDILWYHNERCINKNEDFVVRYDHETGKTEVVIVECFPEDTGVFKCVASNSEGNDVTSCQLTVAMPPEGGPSTEVSEVEDGIHKVSTKHIPQLSGSKDEPIKEEPKEISTMVGHLQQPEVTVVPEPMVITVEVPGELDTIKDQVPMEVGEAPEYIKPEAKTLVVDVGKPDKSVESEGDQSGVEESIIQPVLSTRERPLKIAERLSFETDPENDAPIGIMVEVKQPPVKLETPPPEVEEEAILPNKRPQAESGRNLDRLFPGEKTETEGYAAGKIGETYFENEPIDVKSECIETMPRGARGRAISRSPSGRKRRPTRVDGSYMVQSHHEEEPLIPTVETSLQVETPEVEQIATVPSENSKSEAIIVNIPSSVKTATEYMPGVHKVQPEHPTVLYRVASDTVPHQYSDEIQSIDPMVSYSVSFDTKPEQYLDDLQIIDPMVSSNVSSDTKSDNYSDDLESDHPILSYRVSCDTQPDQYTDNLQPIDPIMSYSISSVTKPDQYVDEIQPIDSMVSYNIASDSKLNKYSDDLEPEHPIMSYNVSSDTRPDQYTDDLQPIDPMVSYNVSSDTKLDQYPEDLEPEHPMVSYSASLNTQSDKYADQILSAVKVDILHKGHHPNLIIRETEKMEVELLTQVEEVTQEAPQFKKPIKPQICKIGQGCVFTAFPVGEPTPQVRWLKDRTPIEFSDRIRPSYNNQTGEYSLTLMDAQLDDSGNFACQAISEVGKATCTANLVVIRKYKHNMFLFIF